MPPRRMTSTGLAPLKERELRRLPLPGLPFLTPFSHRSQAESLGSLLGHDSQEGNHDRDPVAPTGPATREGRLGERLDGLGPAPRAELLHVLMLPTRAGRPVLTRRGSRSLI
jgi:hypothetical protein